MKFNLKQIGRAVRGFTLIELIVSITIFMMFSVMAMNAFVIVIKSQRENDQIRMIYNDLRKLTDFLNENLRDGKIDYLCYRPPEDISNLQKELVIDFSGKGPVKINTDVSIDEVARCTNSIGLGVESRDNLKIVSNDGLRGVVLKVEGAGGSDDSDEVTGKLLKVKALDKNGENWEDDEFVNFGFENIKLKNLTFEIFPNEIAKYSKSSEYKNKDLKPYVRVFASVESLDGKFNFDYQTLISER